MQLSKSSYTEKFSKKKKQNKTLKKKGLSAHRLYGNQEKFIRYENDNWK